ncbi:MAG: DUF3857 domain-containing protein [Kiritimatiellae bacterium]|nr:DUF3857 domain-containing protein [Kiritimatiellia bacterium]
MTRNVLVLAVLAAWTARAELTPPENFLLDRDAVVRSAAAVTADKYPDADEVLVNDSVLELVSPDSKAVTWDDEYCKVLTEKGRRGAATANLSFMAHYGTVAVYRMELIKPDGRVVVINHEEHSKVRVDDSQMGSNIYDPDCKILSLTVPGIEVGDIRHLVVVRTEIKKRMPGTWCDYNIFENTSPILDYTYTVSLPKELPLRHKILRDEVPGTVTSSERQLSDGRTEYVWTIRNVPQIFPEPDMPPLSTVVQRLMLSTIGSWKDISKWYWGLCEPQLEKITPEMREHVAKLVSGAENRDEKIRRIFKFVSQEIRYMGITTEDVAPGYEPHDVSMTFKNRYGVCRDKAALLVSLLRVAGIQAYPVLIHVGAKRDPDAPMPYFNHAITAVDDEKGGYMLMDSTNESTRDIFPAYLCNKSYLVARPEGETLLVSPVYPAEKNLLTIETSGTIERNGSILLNSDLKLNGVNDTVYRGYFLRHKEEDRRRFFERMLKSRLPGAEVLVCEISPKDLQNTEIPVSIRLTTRVPDYPVRGEGADMLNLPWLSGAFGYVNFIIGATGLPKRRYPMETEVPCGVKETIRLGLSGAMGEPRQLPSPVSISRNGLVYNSSVKFDGGDLTAAREHLITGTEFSPAQYLELKEDLKTIEAAGRERPLFAASGGDMPDQEVLFDRTVVTLDSGSDYITDHIWSKRILTYNGKKKGSEVIISFNPVWQTVELVSASVSNVTGEVKNVTPKEINLMDPSWVGSAPRYPGAKQEVISLPGVEVGSVVTVHTRVTKKNGYFYSHCHAFGGGIPVAEESYTLNYPKSLGDPAVFTYNGEGLVETVDDSDPQRYSVTWSLAAPHPAVKDESSQSPWHFFQPAVYVSCGDWKAHATRLGKAMNSAASESREARRRAKELVKDLRDPRERLLAVRNEVMRTIRVAGPSFLGLPSDCAFSSPDKTLADQYGHAADRALLLREMLDAAGFDAEVLFASGDTTMYPEYGYPSREVPQIGYFASPVVRVRCKGQTWLLNEGDQYSELGTSALNGAYALNGKGRIEQLEVAEPLQNRDYDELRIDLSENGDAVITVTDRFYGTSVGAFRRQYDEMLPEDRRRHYLELVGAVAKAAVPLTDLETDTKSYPGVRTYQVKVPNFAVVKDGVITVQLPGASVAVFPFRDDTRQTPMFLRSNSTSEWVCELTLPPGYGVRQMLPGGKNWEMPNGTGTLDFTVDEEKGGDGRTVLHFRRQVSYSAGELPPELYPALMEYNRILSHPSMRTVIYAKSK